MKAKYSSPCKGIVLLILNLCIRWDISDPLHVLATLPLRKDASAPTVWEVGRAVEPASCSLLVLKHICLAV